MKTGATWRKIAFTAALFALPSLAIGAGAVTLKGRIAGGGKLMNPVWNEAKEPQNHHYTFREPSATVRADARQLTGFLPKELCIAALGDKGAPNKAPLRMAIAGGRTSPVTLVVAEGQQIQFDNGDPFPHRIYDTTNKLIEGDIPPGGKRGWTPPNGPGKYEIRDKTAPSIRSWIVVEPKTVAVSYPDRKGEFTIDVEPGKYKLRAYFNGEPVGQELDVDARPGPAEQPLKGPLNLGDAAQADAGAK